MRPIRLELSGLNSYTDKQVIDFKKLTSRGLFGIFGNTGSGKSTILDAITIALYGDISRKTTDYINSNCDKAVVKYEFEIGSKNNRKRYYVERTIKTNNTGGTKTSRVLLGEIKDDGDILVLADKVGEVKNKIHDIIGLTSEDFTRSVVLPQGKFSEFLKLQDGTRRKMLERIFNLEKYGEKLSNKVKDRRKIIKAQSDNLEGQLITFTESKGISEELYEKVKDELKETINLEKEKHIELDKEEKDLEISKVILENQKYLQKYSERKKELDLLEKEINLKREQIERNDKAENIVPHINDIKLLEKDINENTCEVEKLDVIIGNLKKEIDLLSTRYDEAYKEKNEKLPILIEERSKLQRGIELEEKVENLYSKIKSIKVEIENYDSNKGDLEKDIQELEYQISSKYNKIQENRSLVENLSISTELKENIFAANNKEEELSKLSDEKEEKYKSLKEVEKRLEKLKSKNINIEKNKNSMEEKLKRLMEKQEFLERNFPGDSKLVLREKENLHNLKSKLENIKYYESQIKNIKNELNKNEIIKFENNRNLKESTDKIERLNKNLEDLKKEQEQLAYLNMASYLREKLDENEPCPVCGSINHEKTYYNSNYEEAKLVDEKIKKLEIDLNREKSIYEDFSLRNREITSIENIKQKSLEDLENKLGDVSSSTLEKEIDIKQKELRILEDKVTSWEEDKNTTIEEIYKIKDEKNEIEKEEVKIKENLNSDNKLKNELKEKIQNLKINYDSLNIEYLSLKSKVKVSNLSSKVKEIAENEKTVEKLNKEVSELNKEKELLDNKLKEKNIAFNEIDKKLSNLLQLRDTRYKEVKGYEDELNKITKGISCEKLLKETLDDIERIVNNEELLKNELNGKRYEYEENAKIKSSKDGILSQAKKQLDIQNQTLINLLIENKFDSINTVEKSLLKEEDKNTFKDEIEKYNEEKKYVILKIEDYNKKLDGRSIKEEDLQELQLSISNLKSDIAKLRTNIGSKENELKNIEKSLESMKDLRKEIKKVKHELSLLDEINKLIMGNKFVEFVATNQLKYIALEASKRLSSITRGRYALEIDENLNFIMRDNMNGGQRRSVDSLSGGETFLTSLSLALALSSQIQLKGNSPLEFFFLDEGFGSLDIELLDIVMESLENLHSDKLSVGIISHVEELKNRVPVKLLVSPCDVGKGSRVKIEYS